MGLRRIPLVSYPAFTQQCDLDGVTFSFRFRFSERDSCWHMDLRTLDDQPVVLSARLVTGFFLLRRVVNPARPLGELIVLDLSGPGDDCETLEDFGQRFGLFYLEAV